jgi:hypothetical protein
MDTFGKFDWAVYYKLPKGPGPLTPDKDCPCDQCPKGRNKCSKALDPATDRDCWRFTEWVRKWWPVVTGHKEVPKDKTNWRF